MKKTRKHLALTGETLRELAASDLNQALGGLVSELCTLFCPTQRCPPPPSRTCPQ